MMPGLLILLAIATGDVRPGDIQVYPRSLAPRGGVLMARLTSNAPGPWPMNVPVDLLMKSGEIRTLVGHIGWLEERPERAVRSWGTDPLALWIRAIRPTDRLRLNVAGTAGPRLLLALPPDGDGPLVLAGRQLQVRWVDAPESMPQIRLGGGSREGVLTAVDAADHPAADNPLSWWRWELLAERLGQSPPPPSFGDVVQRLAARHVSGVWRIGMTRLTSASRGVAARCRDLLTETCHDGNHRIAAWVTNAGAIDRLLRTLFDPTLDDHGLIAATLAWADAQVTQVAWIEQSFGPTVSIALANPDPKGRLAEYLWTSDDDVPIGMMVPADQVSRANLYRPAGPVTGPRLDILNIVMNDHLHRIPFGAAVLEAVPPGPLLGPFVPTLSLSEARAIATPGTAADRQTFLQLRRIGGQWQVYLECLLPEPLSEASPDLPAQLQQPLMDLRGHESVTLMLGTAPVGLPTDENWATQVITVTPDAGWRRYRGGSKPPTIETRVQEDRWLATINIPTACVEALNDRTRLLLAAVRGHQRSQALETIPLGVVPWAQHLSPIYLDLQTWETRNQPTLRSAGQER
jgi:hypothetical protein